MLWLSKIRILIVALVFIPLLWGCAEDVAPKKLIRPVKSILVADYHAAMVMVLPGKVRAADKVDMAFQVPGQLKILNAVNGQRVAKGSVLAQLDSRDFQSNLKAAKAEYQRAQADFRRYKELVERQLISTADFDGQRAVRDIAEANVEKVQKALDDTQLVAPFSGVIAHRYVDNFEDINAKQPILSLQNMDSLEVVIQVPENSIPRDKNLEEEQEQIEAFARFQGLPDRLFDLDLKEFALDADPRTQSFEMVLQMATPPNFSIYPGMSVSVEASLPMDDETHLLLPASAVFSSASENDQQFVWELDLESLTVKKVPVLIGSLQGDKIEVISGVRVGMRVVTAGVNYLTEGERVRLMDEAGGA